MKKLSVLILIFLLVGTSFHVSAQNLLKELYGTWNVTKYQSKIKTAVRSGAVEFQEDGSFKSQRIHFGTKAGLYRTDETRSLVIIDTDGVSTEWLASMKKGVLLLRSTPAVNKKLRVHLTLVRRKEV